MHKQPLLAVAVCALVGALAGPVFAGEVSGPPGSEDPNSTGAPDNANSNCAYSGLNDFDEEEGQNDSFVQTVADAWKYYGLPHGLPGWGGACKGGTNEHRDKP